MFDNYQVLLAISGDPWLTQASSLTGYSYPANYQIALDEGTYVLLYDVATDGTVTAMNVTILSGSGSVTPLLVDFGNGDGVYQVVSGGDAVVEYTYSVSGGFGEEISTTITRVG